MQTTPVDRERTVLRHRLTPFTLIAALVLAFIAALLPAGSAQAATGLEFTPISTSFTRPVQVVPFPDGSGRVAVVEKRGSVKVVKGATVLSGVYLSLGGQVTSNATDPGSEQGLLGLAFGRSFSTNPVLFVTYVRNDGALVVSKLRAYKASSPNVRATTEQVLLVIPHPTYQNHNGGSVLFGPDGLLYVTTGDGGGAGDPRDQSRRLTSLLGKVLRIDVYRSCGGLGYCIPDTNPFRYNTVNRREIFAWGLRNPWRVSFDSTTGDLWIADVGQDRKEEVNRVAAGSRGGNFGWPCREGDEVFDANRCAAGANYLPPVVAYCHGDLVGCDPLLAGDSVTGGEVYRGSAIGSLSGLFVFGDFISGNVWSLTGATMTPIASLPFVTDFGRAPNGEILAVTWSGGLYRLEEASP